MLKSVLSETSLNCTGCGACSAVCPVGAININLNKEGFLSPEINEKCIHCSLCQQVCYKFVDTGNMPVVTDKSVYGCHSVDSHVHRTTTSGGFAYELSRWGIEHGYKIFGTIYDYYTDMAKCIIVDNVEDLELLKGSKYIQSNTEAALKTILADAKENPTHKYICIGTPCQIFGLRKLIDLKRLSNDIILVDLFCHGVPSYLVWKPYVRDLRNRLGNIEKVEFRYKGNGWHQYSIRVEGKNDSYTSSAYSDIFYRYFFDNVVLNSSCFDCSLRKQHSAADLRLGDFLGQAYEHREDGISAVLPLTKKGSDIIDMLHEAKIIHVDKVFDASVCLRNQSTHDYSNKKLRDAVVGMLQTNNIRITQKYYYRQFSLKKRIYAFLKYCVSKLPVGLIVRIRRTIRRMQ